jgi:Flp pilus assembly protein TadD
MSLLMKALEKAAKDRSDTNGDPAAPAQAGTGANVNSELTLEPIAAQAAEPAASTPSTPTPPPREKSAAAPAATVAAPQESAQTAALIRAAGKRESSGSVFGYLRDRPLMIFGALAVLFLIGFGGYVYVQMNPGMFITRTTRPATSAPITQAPVPPPSPQGVVGSGAPAAAQQLVPLSSLTPPTEKVAAEEKSAKTAATAAATAAAIAPAPVPIAPAAPRDTIKITTVNAMPTVNPVLSEAYGALSAGNLESSQRLYNQLLKNDPRNVEALLGLAAIATQQGDRDAATRHYIRVIEADPRNAFAQAGLIGMLGRADPQSAETRVKQLLARDPGIAYLHFTLGNTYIDQNRWPDAQQAFFQAHHLQPDNADYAYNLAVALEHIGQTKSALDFYRQAVQLAAAKGHANFSTAAAQERVSKLEKIVR